MKKVIVNLDENLWHGKSAERLWAKELDNNLYQIDNIPIFAMNISLGDIVEIKNKNGELVYKKIKNKSKFCTYRVIFNDELTDKKKEEFLQRLITFGVYEFYEDMSIYAFSISSEFVPDFYKQLELLENKKVLDFEEADYH
ncbi:DUF4265 domain-containing protein [Malaciobacter sp. WC5094]